MPALTSTVHHAIFVVQQNLDLKFYEPKQTTGPRAPTSPGALAFPATDRWPSPLGQLYQVPEQVKPGFSDPESSALATMGWTKWVKA